MTQAAAQSSASATADVIVVGAGPAGSSAAYHMATLGLDVILLEKQELGRDKVCGDGLTPSAVRELVSMGVDTSGWQRNRGLRVIGGGHLLHFPWPEQASFPSYGMARPRALLDRDLAEHAAAAGARLLTGVTVTGPVTSPTGRVTGVEARPTNRVAYPGIEGPTTFTAPLVVDAGGVSARLATAVGRIKNERRPMGVAVRAYFRSPRAKDAWMESRLELWDGTPGKSDLLPGYGWIWSVGEGLVNVGLGSVSSRAQATSIDYRAVFNRWMDNVPASWGFTKENQVGGLVSAALPMAFNRKPHYADGLMLLGDAGGVSARLATALGRTKNERRPMGVAVRAYFRSPRAKDAWMESRLELWDGKPGKSDLLPGYGWIWSVGEGLVNVGLGSVSSRASATAIDYRAVFNRWMDNVPASWGFTKENQVGGLVSAALPMAFNRKPHYADGLMLLGDAGGMVSPFNGEGIAQALLSGRLAAQAAAQASARTTTSGREQVLAQYPKALSSEMGGYYTLGRVFVALIEHPEVMRLCTRYGLPRKRLMKLVTKLLSDGWERRGGDGIDHFIQLLTRMVPEA